DCNSSKNGITSRIDGTRSISISSYDENDYLPHYQNNDDD
ncbi:17199_t:CDS:1, partial [Entrophospora sp. SA101]